MNKSITFFILFAWMSLAIAQNPEDFLNKGNEYFESGDYSSAITQYEQAIQLDVTFAPAMFQSSLSYLRLGEMEKTKEFINLAIEADQENEEYRKEFERINEINTGMNDGNRAYRNGLYDDAMVSYQGVLDKFPFFAEAAYSLGLVYMQADDLEKAIESFHTALELNSSHESAQTAIANVAKRTFNEGNQCYKRRDLDCAIEKYQQVINIDPTFFQAYYQTGVIEARQGNYTFAIENYKLALQHNPEFYKGWFALGLVQKRDGDPESALVSLKKTVEIHPGYAKAYGAMGDIYIELKRFDEALSILLTATQVDPTYAKGYLSLGTVYIELAEVANAVTSLDMATSLDPEKHQAWYLLAQSNNELGQCDEAKEAALQATDLKEKFGGGWYELANAEWCNGQGNKTAALNHLEKARNDRAWRKSAEYLMDKIKNPQKYQED
ncbi:MAG: tetratricopeptide repeat protein [Candidatus Marinimicrobia bacterium]|nr:tetratricopeptide repeat protein [Candidatus Neomarinimicrobiota bacterium]